MKLQEQLTHTLDRTPASLQALSEFIDPLWIAQALQTTGCASIRRRKLPAEQVVWLVIGLALFRNQSIASVVRQLNLSLGGGPCVPSAAVQGRQRLGDVALEHLFRQLASAWGAQAPGLDALDERDGLHGLLDAQVSAMRQSEVTLAAALTPLPQSLTIFDRAYFLAAFLLDSHRRGQNSHWLLRARDNLRHEVLESLGPGDSLIRMPISPRAKQLFRFQINPRVGAKPQTVL